MRKSIEYDLIAWRNCMGLSRESMADYIGVSFGTYIHWEYGYRAPSGPNLNKIFELYSQCKERGIFYPKIIGISGLAGSGKTFLADAITNKYNLGYQKMSFASPIKTMLSSVFGDDYFYKNKSKEVPGAGCTARRMMQTLGTEWGRGLINEKIWINVFEKNREKASRGIVVDDVRFTNEAEYIKDNQGILVLVGGHGVGGCIAHESERGIDSVDFDFVIKNGLDYFDQFNDFLYARYQEKIGDSK